MAGDPAPKRWLKSIPVIGDALAALDEERTDAPDNKFAAAALDRHKREGMALAFRARLAAMVVIAILLPIVNPRLEVLWYEALALGFVLIGWLQTRAAQVERSRTELALILADLVLLTVTLLVPNPFSENDWPATMNYRFGGFIFFFVFLALATLAYSWRTVWGVGFFAAVIWGLAYAAIKFAAPTDPALTKAAHDAFGAGTDLAWILDPNYTPFGWRLQEVVALLIVAAILAAAMRRFTRLLLDHVEVERERTNLARYFSPNVVDELSRHDEPLKQVRTQNVAVLFVDIVGFTQFASERTSEEVIDTLRDFHGRMEAEVFRHKGTLDKYLGDGMMATFGTPFAGDRDATNALACARDMMAAVEAWNAERAAAGAVPIRASFGVHFGPVVLGDIGANRLEFAVIGDTVNVASRVEAMTRPLGAAIAVTEDLKRRVEQESDGACALLTGDLACCPAQEIRGLERRMDVWTLGGQPAAPSSAAAEATRPAP